MYNPEFWEVAIDQADLERFPNEANPWFESSEDREVRYQWEDRVNEVAHQIYGILSDYLTRKQYEVVILYYRHRKTQQEISEILGISRRVVSQHLFGIYRNGRPIGGAMNKLRKQCVRQGIGLEIHHRSNREWQSFVS